MHFSYSQCAPARYGGTGQGRADRGGSRLERGEVANRAVRILVYRHSYFAGIANINTRRMRHFVVRYLYIISGIGFRQRFNKAQEKEE
jgi:hypothetical protein